MNDSRRFSVLDGWRGISILAVLAAHLLPLGPKWTQANLAAGYFGMSIFFTLSGFLICHFLLHHDSVLDFIIRRFCRILPLALVGATIGLVMVRAGSEAYVAHYLFYANYPDVPLALATDASFPLKETTAHLWSLCVEVQFYVVVALLVFCFRKRGLYILPTLCLFVTANRIYTETHASIITHLRVDEILAGSMLALIYNNENSMWLRKLLAKVNPYVALALLIVASFPQSGWCNYLRPYAAMLLIGSTLLNPAGGMNVALNFRWLAYIATISYALYVIHPLLGHTWLGEGSGITKYLKRIPLFVLLFLLAHISTFFFEQRFISWGKNFGLWLASRSKVKSEAVL